MSRLEFGPKPRQMEVTDIASGHFVFAPVEGNAVSFDLLDEAITKAGYEIESASLAARGVLDEQRRLRTPDGESFRLSADSEALGTRLFELEVGAQIEVEGIWSAQEGSETLVVTELREIELSEAAEESP